MVDTHAFEIFRDAPADDLAMLGFIHALQLLAEVVLDEESKREQVWQALRTLTDKALQSDLSEQQLDYYLQALHAVDVSRFQL